MNSLLRINWEKVRMLSLNDDHSISVLCSGDSTPRQYPFADRLSRDTAFRAWIDLGKTLDLVSPTPANLESISRESAGGGAVYLKGAGTGI